MADSKLLEIIQHVFLPPQLPHESTEGADEALWNALLSKVMESLRAFLKDVVDTSDVVWASHALATLQRANDLRNSPALNDPGQLAEKIQGLAKFHIQPANTTTGMPPTDPLAPQLPIFFPKHNAGLLISSDKAGLRFEMFELHAPNEDIMRPDGRLSRTFPGPSIIVPLSTCADISFCHEVARFVSYANSDRFCLQMLCGSSKESDEDVDGEYDTVSPAMIEGLLSSILLSLGKRCEGASRILKQTRDEVMWKESDLPWRRSALWLFIRVVLQLQSQCVTGSSCAYKKFMISFMSLQLKEAHSKHMSMELLFCMAQKISKRLLKLKIDNEPAWSLRSEAIITKVCSALHEKWQAIEKMDSNSPAVLSLKAGASKPVGPSITIQLSKLQKYLDKIKSNAWHRDLSRSTSELPFSPNFKDSSDFIQKMRSFNRDFDELDTLPYLHWFESWVDTTFSDWLSEQLSADETTTAIAESMKNYHRYASQVYAHQPESLSIMYLTVMSLWVELDRTVCACHPLLFEYPPEINEKILEPCLLPRISDMERVHSIEHYIRSRRQKAVQAESSAVLDVDSPESFPVRYFGLSDSHQELKEQIQNDAAKERERKIIDMKEKKSEYDKLMKQYDQGEPCSCLEHGNKNTRAPSSEHRNKRIKLSSSADVCPQCNLLKQANNIVVTVHEWPLPTDDNVAKAVVFALDTPKSFSSWRDSTYFMLNVVFQGTSRNSLRPPDPYTPVHALRSLQKYASANKRVLQLASPKKPHQMNYQAKVKIVRATETTVLRPNTNVYCLYDTSVGLRATAPAQYPDTRPSCTPALQGEEYQPLQTMISNTTHTSNEVVCRKREISSMIDEHEFIAFGTFRAGHRLQWLNLLRQLVAQELDFRKPETELLVTQSLWQLGPEGTGCVRDSHEEALSLHYQTRLCRALTNALTDFQDNWQAAPALRVFTTAVSRMISLDREGHSKTVCLDFLRDVRKCFEKWIGSLRVQLHNSQDEVAQQIRLNVFRLALDLSWTFNLDHDLFREVMQSEQDARLFFLSSLLVHHYQPPTQDASSRRMFYRHIRLLQNENDVIDKYILDKGQGLQLALSALYEGNTSGLMWKRFKEPRQEWYEGQLNTLFMDESFSFQYNSMSGELRRNLIPLARLPKKYEQNPTYIRLLGTRMVEVVDSSLLDFDFESRELIAGYRFFFAFHDPDLRIGLSCGNEWYEVVPTNKIEEELPHSLVSGYVHIYHRGSSTISFRPLSLPWGSDAAEWQLQGTHQNFIITSSQGEALIDPRSQTFRDITSIFQPIEIKKHLVLVLDKSKSCIRIKLPRLHLGFFLEISNLEIASEDFPGMYIDVNQSCDTFTGLQSKLVLRSQVDDDRRIVLVPDLPLRAVKTDEHVSVDVDSVLQDELDDIEWHCFKLHPLLQQVEDDGTLSSQLFRCLIHAMTSSPFIDSLTCMTGTEQALSILQDPCTNSYMKLEAQDIQRLNQIVDLSCTRSFNPVGQKSMQRVEWRSLHALSQHPALRIEVSKFLQRASDMRHFQGWQTAIQPVDTYGLCSSLAKRALARDSYLRTDTFRYDRNVNVSDEIYTGRKIEELDQLVHSSYEISLQGGEQKGTRKITVNLLSAAEEWVQPIQNNVGELDLQSILTEAWQDKTHAMLGKHWCSLQKWAIDAGEGSHKYGMRFLMALIVFLGFPTELAAILWTLYSFPKSVQISHLAGKSFDLSLGYEPKKSYIADLVNGAYKRSPDASSGKGKLSHSTATPSQHGRSSHNDEQTLLQKSKQQELEELIKRSWPSSIQTLSQFKKFDSEFDSKTLVKKVNLYFSELQKNNEFKNCCLAIQNLLCTTRMWSADINDLKWPHASHQPGPEQYYIKLSRILQAHDPPEIERYLLKCPAMHFRSLKTEQDLNEMHYYLDLIRSLPRDGLAETFREDLLESLGELKTYQGSNLDTANSNYKLLLWNLAHRQAEAFKLTLTKTKNVLNSRTTIAERIAYLVGAWPRIPLMRLVRMASSRGSLEVPLKWSKAARILTRQLANFRNLRRMLASNSGKSAILQDVKSLFERSWADEENPDWLVFEAEHCIVIREEQVLTANRMLERRGSNSLYQLQMGKGKSSVILPILASKLSQGSNLFRALVLGPLLPQMFSNFKKRLSHAIGRRIYYLPTARSCAMDGLKAATFRILLEECVRERGILLLEPENVQSFELMTWEYKALGKDNELRHRLMDTQRWLDRIAVDVFDESDEILRVNRELIYTIGLQQPVDFNPWRWKVILSATSTALEQGQLLSNRVLHGFEIFRTVGCPLPQVRILNSQAETALVEAVFSQISLETFAGYSLWTMDRSQGSSLPNNASSFQLRRFVLGTGSSVDTLNDNQYVMNLEEDQRKLLFLLRGLLGGGLLSFCLMSHRWRVSFGLDRQRSRLAVPYRGKDTPSQRTDFSHPDVTIILTVLSYFYGGLSDDELRSTIENLQRDPSGEMEYASWVKSSPTLPLSLHHLKGINLLDQKLYANVLLPALRHNPKAIQSYLFSMVFPSSVREFPSKMASSGWHLVRKKSQITTGFSGTNDSQYLLPYPMRQGKLPGQNHTNADLLVTILQAQNTMYFPHDAAHLYDEDHVRRFLADLPLDVKVVIDVGAQFLGCDNERTSRTWLNVHCGTAAAAIHFDSEDNLCVIDKSGKLQALEHSPYISRLGECLVYLDEPHTRGTDLNLPNTQCALVTIGPFLTLDRFMQACLRMRKLRLGQKLLVYSPAEVCKEIKILFSLPSDQDIKIRHILAWCTRNSQDQLRAFFPLWVSQGMNFLRQQAAKDAFTGGDVNREALSQAIIDHEALTIMDRYHGTVSADPVEYICSMMNDGKWPKSFRSHVDAIMSKKQMFGDWNTSKATFSEQQERELAPENENEVEKEHATAPVANSHSLHPSIEDFVKTGKFPKSKEAVIRTIDIFKYTSIDIPETAVWEDSRLFVTEDFTKVTQDCHEGEQDLYLRPIEWVLGHSESLERLIISPHEANALMPLLRQKRGKVCMSLFAPRTAERMVPLDKLTFFTFPQKQQMVMCDNDRNILCLLSGQVFFRNREDYEQMCRFLGLCYSRPVGVSIGVDGFVGPADRGKYDLDMESDCKFAKSPVQFLKRVMDLRRGGKGYELTHMSSMLSAGLDIKFRVTSHL